MNKKNESHSNSEKFTCSALGVGIILSIVPQWIPICVFGGGLVISIYGILDVINKSDARSQFDLRTYIESSNKYNHTR